MLDIRNDIELTALKCMWPVYVFQSVLKCMLVGSKFCFGASGATVAGMIDQSGENEEAGKKRGRHKERVEEVGRE